MSKIVTIYGGSGFLGRHIARRMAKLGWRVRVAVRRPSEALFVRTYGAVGQVEPVPCNIRDDMSVRAAMADAEVVVNCVGIMVSEGKNRFAPVHADGAERIGRLAKEMGVLRVVHISALGADENSDSEYAVTKAQGEAALLKARPDAVILRPSFMFGAEGGLYERMASSPSLGPIMNIVGGNSRVQPVHVDDVAAAACKAAVGDVGSDVYELGGPDVKTLREVAEQMLQATYRRRAIINIPFWLARIGAAVLDFGSYVTGGLLTNRLLTRDQVKLLAQDNVVADGAKGFADLGIKPVAPGAVIDEYLWRFRPNGQYADMTASARNLRLR
ncbi:complex I NDUFA9 subunit family protein [Paracoccus albus]|uniref:complex I NDUFA9 subunit family protein n=1 Tax=Paracoccus albus TaxID=3017784 RepID=UPI0022EFEAD9|nr:complex I NDUFA9 subunit family protein [Paracoccus albus]WBU60169.1 complex I NDUFA9 subunit family protein [Paracoccus albus]